MSDDSALTAREVWFGYRAQWILRGASLRIEPGTVVGLHGPSGSGKSTLARLLTGRARPSQGSVTSPRGNGRAHSSQLVVQHAEQSMNPRWKVRTILAEAAPDPGPVLDTGLVLREWLGSFPHELSGGELQRVNLARALLADPCFVVADEITASLDPVTQVGLWAMLTHGVRTTGYGVLAISHEAVLVDRVSDRVLSIAEIGTGAARPARRSEPPASDPPQGRRRVKGDHG